MLGIADEVVANRIRGLRCLGEQMQPIGFAERIAVKRITRERAQDHQRRHPLPVRRAFIDLVASIRGVDRLDPVRSLVGKIRFRVEPTQRFEPAEDVVHHRPRVERLAALPANQTQGGGKRRVRHLVTGSRRLTTGQEKGSRDRVAQFLLTAVPVGRDARRHDVTLLSGPCRWF